MHQVPGKAEVLFVAQQTLAVAPACEIFHAWHLSSGNGGLLSRGARGCKLLSSVAWAFLIVFLHFLSLFSRAESCAGLFMMHSGVHQQALLSLGCLQQRMCPEHQVLQILIKFWQCSKFIFLQSWAHIMQISVAEVPIPQMQGAWGLLNRSKFIVKLPQRWLSCPGLLLCEGVEDEPLQALSQW